MFVKKHQLSLLLRRRSKGLRAETIAAEISRFWILQHKGTPYFDVSTTSMCSFNALIT